MTLTPHEKNMAQEDVNVIDQPEVLRHKMVTIEISGKKYEVPEGITVIKALWYTGQEVVRGAGCLGGFCGACATYYRTKDDPKVRTCLACQMAVEDGMSFTIMPHMTQSINISETLLKSPNTAFQTPSRTSIF